MTNTEVLALAQRLTAGLSADAEIAFRLHLYRDDADFAALEAVEKNYVPGAPPPVHPEGSWLSFVFSKPSIEDGAVHIHLLEPSQSDAPRANELWMKLKRAEALSPLFAEAKVETSAARLVNAAIVRDTARALAKDAEHFVFEDDEVVATGPQWLRTNISIREEGGKVFVRSPVTLSPVDAPPRFAGMHYMKVISPEWVSTKLMKG